MLALYRKYRPKTLKDVIGQEQVTVPLESALKSSKISHSYLLTGPRGCGKTSVARILAHEINGFKYELEDSYLDIIEIDAASNTGVDNIRDLREKAMIAPSEGKYKVYIIDEVHMLSKSAFNALLKTLEEPPAHVIFILATTDLEKVPVTITSRSQVYTFHLAEPTTMLKHLKAICKKEKIKITDSGLKLIVEKSGGSFRDSLSLLDQISSLAEEDKELDESTVANCLGLPMESKINDLLDAYTEGDSKRITSKLKELLGEGIKPESLASSCLARIIASPTKELLPLLAELPKVSAPYPEAKLLLALLNSSIGRPAASGEIAPSRRAANEKKPTEFSQTIKGPVEEPHQRKTVDDPKNKTEEIKALTLTPALEHNLKKCKVIDSGAQIEIYPPQKIIKTILERPANSEILKSNFDKPFIIHDPEDYEKSPLVSKISDIMGKVQEVNNENGGIPF